MLETNRKVPYVEQLQQTECGLCCAAMILRYYKSYESLSTLRNLMEVGRDGLRLDQIKYLLEKVGFDSKAFKTPVQGLLEIGKPCILYWENNHFVVLEKTNKKYCYIVDPAVGRKKMTHTEVMEKFSGIVLIPQPNENFSPHKKKENPFKILIPNIKKNKKLFFIIFILSIFTYVATLLMPIAIQILTDSVIENKSINLSIILLFVVAFILNTITVYARGKYLIKIKAILERDLQSKTFKHLLNVPYKFFEVRAKGDILYRISSLEIIKDLLADKIIRGILDVGALVFMLSYMFLKSKILTSLALTLFLIYFVITYLLRSHIKELNLYEIVERSKLQKIQVETISSIFGIKVAASEGEIYYHWKKKLEDVLHRFTKQSNLGNIYSTFNQVAVLVSPLIILVFAMGQYINGNITIGESIAFYSITTMFFTSASSFFQTWNAFWIASNSIERLNDITDVPQEDMNVEKDCSQITGDIKLENVSFAYTANSENIIRDISLQIKSGQKIAIVGESGSGKSTLAKLLMGLYQPTKGMIYYDGLPLNGLNKKKLRKQMAIVPQEIQLLNKSIYENISMGNLNASAEEVKKAAEIAQISETIEEMPMKYDTLISDMGSNLSGGQRQRIALAKSILNKHSVVILDEATSSLDSLNELKISNYFKDIGCTCIIIAHRLSTIMNCDSIFVLDKGEIIEEGTHEELIKLNGKYSELYHSTINSNQESAVVN
ncbi:ABC transporter [Bacillus cereus]|nr:ABC transporter [Bacillus cereus]PGU69804.1 ABC transporter [Bacillus cereus]